jgi:hypothetical protein
LYHCSSDVLAAGWISQKSFNLFLEMPRMQIEPA